MCKEELYFNKLKKGLISKEEYNKLTGEDKFEEIFKTKFNWIDQKKEKNDKTNTFFHFTNL